MFIDLNSYFSLYNVIIPDRNDGQNKTRVITNWNHPSSFFFSHFDFIFCIHILSDINNRQTRTHEQLRSLCTLCTPSPSANPSLLSSLTSPPPSILSLSSFSLRGMTRTSVNLCVTFPAVFFLPCYLFSSLCCRR